MNQEEVRALETPGIKKKDINRSVIEEVGDKKHE
jgi:hypothetical protein